MPANSWAVIYCPKEGSTRTHKRWKNIKAYLQEKGVNFEYVQSEGVGSVERLASMLTRSGFGTIVVVGGDSALNHALCGIMNTPLPEGKHPVLGVSFPMVLAMTLLSIGDCITTITKLPLMLWSSKTSAR